MRNYKAMGDEKLRISLRELEGQYGDAWYRVQDKGGYIDEHLAEARAAAYNKGILDGDVVAPAPAPTDGSKPLGEAKECSECGKRRRHYVDDYICKDCRDALETNPAPEGPANVEVPARLVDADAVVNADDLMGELQRALNGGN